MMDWPGVLCNDSAVLAKLQAAVDANRTVDGHAPGITASQAIDYIHHGISTDHECYSLDDALVKLKAGMKIQIREGSGSRNLDELHPIVGTHPDLVMFCTDDAHPDMVVEKEIDFHVRKSIGLGYDLFDILRIASLNPDEHYMTSLSACCVWGIPPTLVSSIVWRKTSALSKHGSKEKWLPKAERQCLTVFLSRR
jgi:adenine deaminase